MNDWVVETPTFEEDLMNGRFVILIQPGINKVVEIIKNKDKEIESLNHKLEIANNKLKMIKKNAQILTPDKLLEIIENYTGFFGKECD